MLLSALKKSNCYAWIWFLGLLGITSSMAVVRYFNLRTSYLDFGVFQHNLASISFDQWWRVFGGHSQFFLLFWASLYQAIPDSLAPIIILFLQALLLCWPIVFLYKIYGHIPALAYALYFPVWYNALFDFHLDHMAVSFLFAFFFLERKNRIWAAAVVALLLALVKETFALQTIFCGLYLLLFKKRLLPGFFLIVSGALYYFFATHYLIPYAVMDAVLEGADPIKGPAFSWLGSSLGEVLGFILMNPLTIFLEIVSNKTKVLYLLYIFGALGFIPLLRPSYLLVALPIIGISLLSQEPNHSGFMHHYTAGIIAPAVMAFSEGLPEARKLWAKLRLSSSWFHPLLVFGLILCHMLASPSPIGRKFWFPLAWHYHYKAYWFTERNTMIKEALLRYIPADPQISVSTQNTLNFGHLAHRKQYGVYPNGVEWPFIIDINSEKSILGLWEHIKSYKKKLIKKQEDYADFVVIDLKRPWFIMDQSCDWYEGKCQNRQQAEKFQLLLSKTKKRYQTIFREDDFIILKRKFINSSDRENN